MLHDPVFWRTVTAGVIVSWPGIVVSVWLSHRGLRQHLDRVTRRQTGTIKDLTATQTEVLLAAREPETQDEDAGA